jgi:hypothetical protein
MMRELATKRGLAVVDARHRADLRRITGNAEAILKSELGDWKFPNSLPSACGGRNFMKTGTPPSGGGDEVGWFFDPADHPLDRSGHIERSGDTSGWILRDRAPSLQN